MDDKGNRFTPTHTVKAGQRYRYYVDQVLVRGTGESKAKIRRIPAAEIEGAVRSGLADFLGDPARIAEMIGDRRNTAQTDLAIRQARRLAQDLTEAVPKAWRTLIRPFLKLVVVRQDAVVLRIARKGLQVVLSLSAQNDPGFADHATRDLPVEDTCDLIVPARIRMRAGVMKLVIGNKNDPVPRDPDAALIKAIVRGHNWFEQIRSGKVTSFSEIAESSNVSPGYIIRILRLAFLAPHLIESILDGRHPVELTADHLTLREDIPLGWRERRDRFGFDQT